jgi:CheY-like chemotaxis protein
MQPGGTAAGLSERADWEPPVWSRFRASTLEAHGRRNAATVLVVDDNEAVRVTVAEVLRFVGYTVIESGDGADALRLLGAMKFDAMVLDLRMPRLDGASLLAALAKPPPVVVLSAYDADDEAWDNARRAVTAHLKKPVPPQQLIEAVANAVSIT